MESYGMHTDFDKACSIAGLQDAAIKNSFYKRQQQIHQDVGWFKLMPVLPVKALQDNFYRFFIFKPSNSRRAFNFDKIIFPTF